MADTLHSRLSADDAQAQRQAYNAAFEDLGLNWHWDEATFARVHDMGRDCVRQYLEREHPHLLRAYDAQFLANAIEAAKARYCPAATAVD